MGDEVVDLAELIRQRWNPGAEGVVLTNRFVAFRDIFALAERTGSGVSLTREVVHPGGSPRFVVRGGSGSNVYLGFGQGEHMSHLIAHVHLPRSRGSQDHRNVSRSDMEALRRRHVEWKRAGLPGNQLPHSRVVWGPELHQQTFFLPDRVWTHSRG